jgi:prepilin-type N-terminal cleavage/methylation domain-containing protein
MKPFTFYKTDQTAGFTLIEVLVVVIIAGILAGIAAPGWLAFLNRQRVSTVKTELMQTLKNAQQDAIQRRLSRPIKVENTATVPTVVVNGVTQTLGGDASNPGNLRLRSYSVNSGGTQDATYDTITFDYRGLPTISKSTVAGSTSSTALPFVISIAVDNSNVKQCVIVANLLGTLKTASNAQCDNPTL